MSTSKCTFCSTIMCEGCSKAYKPFFTGYRPQFVFKTIDTNNDATGGDNGDGCKIKNSDSMRLLQKVCSCHQ
ncbi:hypothetical protein JCM16163A_41070 [Paenibacillus sp. YK5]